MESATDGPWRLKSKDSGNNYSYIKIENDRLGLFHLQDPTNRVHAAHMGYVDDEIEKVENAIDNPGDTFMPKSGGEFTGAVKYSNVNDNMASATTLMHKQAFDSVLGNFQMGDRRYHSVYINRGSYPNTHRSRSSLRPRSLPLCLTSRY